MLHPVRRLAPPLRRRRLQKTEKVSLHQPRCCLRSLFWELPRFRYRRATFRADAKRARARERKLAVRCLDCYRVFCPGCARKHFAPVRRAELVMARALSAAPGRPRR